MRSLFPNDSNEQDPRYYGWVAVGLSFLTLAFGGSIAGTFPVFYVAFLEEFGWSRADTALAFSISMATFALSAGSVGALIDRWGPRIVVPVGVAVLGTGLALTSTVSNLLTLCLYYGVVVALGITLIGFVPTSAVVSRWFQKRRATAMGIAYSGRSIGRMLMVPLAQFLIVSLGWRGAYLALGLGVIVFLLPLNAAFHRGFPAAGKKGAAGAGSVDWTMRMALRDRTFWLLFVSGIAQGISFSIVMVHLVAHMTDIGISKMLAASLLGFLALLGAAGGVIGGWVADRAGRFETFLVASLLAFTGLLLLMSATSERMWLVYGFVVFLGLGAGARGTVFISLKADIFPGRHFGRILGFSQMGAGLASSVGPWLAGYIFDVAGSYLLAFWVAAAMNVLAVGTVAVTLVFSERLRRAG